MDNQQLSYIIKGGYMNNLIEFEQWLPLTENIIPNIKPFYMISSFGRVYSTQSNKMIKAFKYPDTGYYHIGVRMQDNTSKHFSVHRLVMMVFRPIDNPEDFEVNHKDGDKSKNYLYNLEWCIRYDNIQHAWVTGLYHQGEDHHNASLTNEQVHIICQGLEKNLSYNEIANLADIEFTSAISSCISDIKAGRRWKIISSQYTFTSERSYQLFSNEQIHYICKCLEENIDTNSILDRLKYTVKSIGEDELIKRKRCIQAIRRRSKFKDISLQYNFNNIKSSTTIETAI